MKLLWLNAVLAGFFSAGCSPRTQMEISPRLVPVLRRATAQDVSDRPRDGAALLRLLDRSGATATVGGTGWDRLISAGAR